MSSPQSAKNPSTFFLSGYYGQGNLGDDLLLRATIEGICRISPVRRFLIRNEGDVSGLKGLSVPVELTGVDRIAADQTKSKFRRLVSTLLAYRRHLRQCDWFVFGGGTVFHERSSVVPLAMTFLLCLLARLLGVRIAALGVGIATMRSLAGRFLLRRIIALSDVFAVRDAAALAECIRGRAGSRVILTADLVFAMTKSLRSGGKIAPSTGAPVIGISVYSPALQHPAIGHCVSEIMRDVLEIIAAREWKVALLVFHHKREGASAQLDNDALIRLVEGLSARSRSQITQTVLDADDVAGIADTFSMISAHCGMRFHGHVLSAIFEKPFVGIAIDNKVDAICRLFGMPVIELNKLSVENVVNAIDQAIVKQIDGATLTRCEDNAGRNFSLLAGRLGS